MSNKHKLGEEPNEELPTQPVGPIFPEVDMPLYGLSCKTMQHTTPMPVKVYTTGEPVGRSSAAILNRVQP